MYRATEDARALLLAAQEIHAEHHGSQTFTPGTHLPLEEAGRRTGISLNHLRYYDAIKEMEYEGAIEWDEDARYARGDKHYGRRQALRKRIEHRRTSGAGVSSYINPPGRGILKGCPSPRLGGGCT